MEQATAEISATILPHLGPALMAGDVGSVGTYRLIAEIGAGGMGVVYWGRKSDSDADCAIKVLAPTLVSDKKAQKRFLREASLTADLRHDRLTGLIDLGEHDGLPYIVMPLLRGETLETRLKREPISSSELVLQVARDTAEGLAFADSRGILHRDIKPSNLWLEFDGPPNADQVPRVKILDLGLARRTADDERVTSTGILLGTPEYMSPEQVRGEEGDARCDLFSLGCVLYRMATGTPPFRGANLMAVLRSLALTDPKPPRQLNPALSRGLSDFIMTLIAKDPAHRLPSAEAALEALDRIDAFRSVVRKATKKPKARKQASGWRFAALTVGVGIFGLAAGAAVALVAIRASLGTDPPVGPQPLAVTKVNGPATKVNAPAQADPPFEPIVIEGELLASDPPDKTLSKSRAKVHVVELQAKKQYRIDLKSSAFDAFLRLENANGTMIGVDDDSGGGTDARFVFSAPTTGIYRIVATSYVPQQVGKYRLTVAEASGIESIMARIQSYANLDKTERARLLDEIKARLVSQKAGPDKASADIVTAVVSQMETAVGQDPSLAAETATRCDEFAAILLTSKDPGVTQAGRVIAGMSRRHRLVGRDLELAGPLLGGEGAEPFDWSRYRGKLVLVDFWAAWCPYCLQELPELKRLHAVYKDRGFEIVGVNSDPTAEPAKQIARAYKIPWPSIREETKGQPQPLNLKYGILFLPTLMLVGPDGKVLTVRARAEGVPMLLAKHFRDNSDLLVQSKAAFDAGNLEWALRQADWAVEVDAGDPQARLLRGRQRASSENTSVKGANRTALYAAALTDFDAALKIDPKSADALHARGWLHLQMGKHDAALADFDAEIAARPEARKTNRQRGFALHFAGKFDEARRQFDACREADGNDVETAVWRFLSMAKAEGVDKARAEFAPVGGGVKRVPMAEIHGLYAGTKTPDEVVEAAAKGNPDPKSKPRLRQGFLAHFCIGLWHDAHGDAKEALRHLDQAVDAFPSWGEIGDLARIERDLLRARKKSVLPASK